MRHPILPLVVLASLTACEGARPPASRPGGLPPQQALLASIPEEQAPTTTEWILAGQVSDFKGPLSGAWVHLMDPLDGSTLFSVQADHTGHFALRLAGAWKERLLLLLAETQESKVCAVVAPDENLPQPPERRVDLTPVTTLASKLMGAKLAEIGATRVDSSLSRARQQGALSLYRELQARLQVQLTASSHVAVITAHVQAQDEPSPTRFEVLADRLIAHTALREWVQDVIIQCNDLIRKNLEDGADQIGVGHWQRHDLRIIPPKSPGDLKANVFHQANRLLNNDNRYVERRSGGSSGGGGGGSAAIPGTLAFASDRSGDLEIYRINLDGSGLVQLTLTPGFNNSRPAYSPDGQFIAFNSDRNGPGYEIWVMEADGSNPQQLTNAVGESTFPAWSPDGSQIAFLTTRDGDEEIYVMDADGNNQTNVSNTAGTDRHPSWSPDGLKIAFSTTRDGDEEIYVMDADGNNQTNISNSPSTENLPVWSPDGSQIAFMTDRDGNSEIYLMSALGVLVGNLTNHIASDAPVPDSRVSWSANGQWMAFTTNRDGNVEVYAMKSDGTQQTNVTQDGNIDAYPAWMP